MAPTTAVTAHKASMALKTGFSEDEITLIKKTIAPGTSDEELALFLYTCKRTGLDPLARQIYAIKRREGEGGQQKMTIQTSIDGYRLIADRTGCYAGSSEPIYDTDSAEHPGWAKVTVYKLVAGEARAFTATARWQEYCQVYQGKPTRTWAKMPYLMLGKCGEALALRKAFPQELSGLYTQDEFPQGTTVQEAGVTVDPTTGVVLDEDEALKGSTLADEVLARAEHSILRLRHAGLYKEILLQAFAAHPGNIRAQPPEVFQRGITIFRHLCNELDAHGKPTFTAVLTPTSWVAEEIRKLTAGLQGDTRGDVEVEENNEEPGVFGPAWGLRDPT